MQVGYPFIIYLFEIIFTFVFSPLVVFQLLCWLSKPQEKTKLLFLIMSLGIGPVALSWLLVMMLLAIPDMPIWSYLIIINILVVFVICVLRSYFKSFFVQLLFLIKKVFKGLFSSPTIFILSVLSLFMLCLILYVSIFIPYIQHDPLEYVVLAKIFYSHSSARMYPIMTGTSYHGFIASYTHPLAYVGLLTWFYIIQGTTSHLGLIRIASFLFYFYAFILVVYVGCRVNKLQGIFSGFLLLTVPAFLNGVMTHQIDAIRIYTFFLFFMFIPVLRMNINWRNIIVAGCLLGLCLFCHSISILAIPLFACIYLIFFRGNFLSRVVTIAAVSLIGLLFVAVRYTENFIKFGSLIHNGTKVATFPMLHHSTINAIADNIYSMHAKWINGFFGLFTNTQSYGISYSLLVFSLLLLNFRLIKSIVIKGIEISKYAEGVIAVSYLVTLAFLGMLILSILMHNDSFIDSARYMISFQPFIAVAGAYGVIHIINYLKKAEVKRYLPVMTVIVIITLWYALIYPVNTIFAYGLFSFDVGNDFAKGARVSPMINVYQFYNRHIVNKGHLLSFDTGRLYYFIPYPFIYVSDPRMLPVYKAKSVQQAYLYLRELGIKYVAVPDYPLFFVDATNLSRLLASPKYARLIYQFNGAKLFQLTAAPQPYFLKKLNLTQPKVINGKLQKGWQFYQGKVEALPKGVRLINTSTSQDVCIYSGTGDIDYPAKGSFVTPTLKPDAVYLLSVDLRGRGIASSYLKQYSHYSGLTTTNHLAKLWQAIPYHNSQYTQFMVQFTVSHKYKRGDRLVFCLTNQGHVDLKSINIYQVYLRHVPTIEGLSANSHVLSRSNLQYVTSKTYSIMNNNIRRVTENAYSIANGNIRRVTENAYSVANNNIKRKAESAYYHTNSDVNHLVNTAYYYSRNNIYYKIRSVVMNSYYFMKGVLYMIHNKCIYYYQRSEYWLRVYLFKCFLTPLFGVKTYSD